MLLDLLFPKFCLGCHRPGGYICLQCQNKLIYLKSQKCFVCKKPSLYNLTHQNCLKKLSIDQVGSIFYYNDFFKKIIKNIKYRYAKEILFELTKIINPLQINFLELYKNLSGKIFIQPIPLHQEKLNERGFNQAYLIANYLKDLTHFTIVDLLIRVKKTKNQAEIKDKKQRYINIKNAFKLKKDIDTNFIYGSRIILVDDVVTSGYTAAEASKTLKKAGVQKVYLFTLAQG